MKFKLLLPFLFVFAACGGDDRAKAAGQGEFETVQEGSAAGVTSTISGPGETIPPMTGTNADTTTAFALNPNAVPPTQPDGTIAGSLPVDPYGVPPSTTGTYRPPVTRTTPSRPVTQPAPQQPRYEPPTGTVAPPVTGTTTTTTTATTSTQPPTDTVAPPPTDTAPPPPPPPAAKPKKETQEDEDEGEQTDTAPPPPPPPSPA
jgi:hypothetical protein